MPWTAGSRTRPSGADPGQQRRQAVGLPACGPCPRVAVSGFATLGCSSLSSLRPTHTDAQADQVVGDRYCAKPIVPTGFAGTRFAPDFNAATAPPGTGTDNTRRPLPC